MTETIEKTTAGQGLLQDCIRAALVELDDVQRDGLKDTPKRWAKMMSEMTSGHQFELTTFPNEGVDEMVVQTGIQFYSLCEHHLVPFFGEAAIAYVPGKRIVGISKLARTVESFARRLQVQERMTQQVAEFLEKGLVPKGVAVVLRARHLCQEMRGVRKSGAETTTSCLRGIFMDEPAARKEFFDMVNGRKA